jgi:DNA-binding LytR/AlgR family response regulator
MKNASRIMKPRQTTICKDFSQHSSPFTAVHVGSRSHIQPANIIMIVADINYSTIFLIDGKKILVSTNIKKLDERFHTFHNMVRVHRSYMLNTQYLKSIAGNTALLSDNKSCQISRRKMQNLLDTMPKNIRIEA